MSEPNFLKKFWHFVTLKTHGNNLLTKGGSAYLTMVSLVVFLAALSEGFAWGSLGKTFSPERPLVGGITLGIFVFCLMWGFDRFMTTSDILKDEYEATLSGKPYEKKPWYHIHTLKKYWTFIVRAGIVVASLVVTAPFLTQFVFKADIEAQMDKEYKNAIDEVKLAELGKREAKITEIENDIKEARQRLDDEISGKRGTGYGKGVAAQNIENEIAALNDELNLHKNKKEQFETELNAAIEAEDEQKLKQYGIVAIKDSPIFREKAIELFKQEPSFQKINRSVDIFLIIIGMILITSKLMQPNSLKLYFSERLQEKWERYRIGAFDEHLPNHEKSTFVLQSKQPIPKEFEQIIIGYMQDEDKRKRREKDLIEEKEKLADEKRHREIELERQQQLQQEQLAASQKKHLERLATQKAQMDRREQNRLYLQSKINQLNQTKDAYLSKHKPRIDELKSKAKALREVIYNKEKIHKSEQDIFDDRQKKIANEKSDLQKLEEIIKNHADKSVEGVIFVAQTKEAITDKKAKIQELETKLLGFQTHQKAHEETITHLNNKLSDVNKELESLQSPLLETAETIAQLQSRQLQFITDESSDLPYQQMQEQELDFLVEQLKEQLDNDVPSYLYFDTKNPQDEKEW